jgi:hypothetical protein
MLACSERYNTIESKNKMSTKWEYDLTYLKCPSQWIGAGDE